MDDRQRSAYKGTSVASASAADEAPRSQNWVHTLVRCGVVLARFRLDVAMAALDPS